MYINKLQIYKSIEKLMPLCLALFFVRTVFIGYRYLFFLLLVPCIVYSVYAFFKQKVAVPNLKRIWLPVLVVLLFFVHFSLVSNVIKESINIFMMLYFLVFSKLYYADDKNDTFLKWFARLTLFAGCLAIARSALSMIGITLPLSGKIFEGNGYSLVNDNNFYSLFFIISIIISIKLFTQNQITKNEHLIINIVAAVNIIVNTSRRAYVLYAIIMALMCALVLSKKYDFKKTLLYNLVIVGFAGIVGICVFGGSYNSNMSYDMKQRCYKIYSSFIYNNTSFFEFNINNQINNYCLNDKKQKDSANLFWVEDLKNNKPWECMVGANDDSKIDIIEEKNDYTIKLQRNVGYGEFQVWYTGRPIVYHKNVTYEITFAFRILTGPENPFYAGWWINEGYGYQHNLPQIITPIDSVWKECKVSYKFREDHINPTCFLNTLSPGTVMELKNIRLTSDDTVGLPVYVDQLADSVINSYFVESDGVKKNYFTAPRTERWRYALELWQTRYDTKQKIFGQGFKYLEWYGEKFYNNPKRYDFPHNPIISSFLYSGIIGGIVYIIFLISSLWLYWKKRKTMGIFFIMYLCCMFFCMFSGSSHFSFPLFAFLSFLPFVEYGKQKNEVSEPAQ